MAGFDLNAALGQYNYRNSVARPGETGAAFYARKQAEYMEGVQQSNNQASAIKKLEEDRDRQNQWEAALTERGLWGGSGSPADFEAKQAADEAKLQRERDLAFGAINKQANFYDYGTAAELEQSMLGGMRGNNDPFSPEVVSGLIGKETDAEAAQLRTEQNLIRSRMANNGVGGGVEARAQIEARRAASKRSRQSSTAINTRSELENSNFRERQQGKLAGLVQQEAANRARTTQQEVDLRSRMQVLGDDQGRDKLANAIMATQAQAQPAQSGPAPTWQQSGRILGNQQADKNKSQYGGVTWLNGSGVNPFMQTSGGVRGNNFGLGGSAGPFAGISQMADNDARGGYGYGAGNPWDNYSLGAYQNTGSSGMGNMSAFERQQRNSANGVGHLGNSSMEKAFNDGQARFGRNQFTGQGG